MTTHRYAALLLLVALVGCATTRTSPVRIDGSSTAAFEASWKALVATLDRKQQARLNTAILLIGATKFRDSGFNKPTSFGPESLRMDLDGKTYDQIIKAGAATGATIRGAERRGGTT